MAFQTQSYAEQALGVAGDISKGFHNYAVTQPVICADDKVCVGCFVQSKADATNENEVVGASGVAITGRILGVVIRDHLTANCSQTNTGLIYPKGENATIITSGSVFIKTQAQAKKWQYVLLDNTTGAMEFSNTMWVDNKTYTGWIVTKGNAKAEDGVIEISTSNATTIATKPTA